MPPRILIVEDEVLVAIEMEAIIEDLGYESAGIAPDLETALSRAESQCVDLALVDLNLRDGLTGPEIGRRLCERSRSTVLFLTANPAILGQGIAGTVGVLTKPTNAKAVAQAVEYALGVRQGQSDLPIPPGLKAFA